jgi:hypothetical protein
MVHIVSEICKGIVLQHSIECSWVDNLQEGMALLLLHY